MFGNADLQAVQQAVRQIDAALRLRYFQEWDQQVLHDQGEVLGVRSAGFSEDNPVRARDALALVDTALDQVDRRLNILIAEAEAADGVRDAATPAAAGSLPVRPGTAFIMMMMDAGRAELEDVKAVICEEFARVGIRAIRADDIEHSDEITHRILDEIRNAEFLIADVTGERPSVYYEIGYAHAIGKRVILYRRKGSPLHFDLAVHNCPEYANLTELRDKLRKRLAALTNREG
jgi:Nucleoside 2-deoxyribosyltransferase